MSATLRYVPGQAYDVAQVTALAFLESAEPVLREIEERSRRTGTRRLLVNLLDVVGTFGPEEQHTIGLLAHRHLSHLDKVASLVPPEKLTRVSEAAARGQGMELRVFSAITDAVDWLLQ